MSIYSHGSDGATIAAPNIRTISPYKIHCFQVRLVLVDTHIFGKCDLVQWHVIYNTQIHGM